MIKRKILCLIHLLKICQKGRGGAQIKGMVSVLPNVNYMLVDVENIRKIEGLRADLAFSYNLIVKYLASISPSEMT